MVQTPQGVQNVVFLQVVVVAQSVVFVSQGVIVTIFGHAVTTLISHPVPYVAAEAIFIVPMRAPRLNKNFFIVILLYFIFIDYDNYYSNDT